MRRPFSRIIGVLAVIIYPQTMSTRRSLFSAFSFPALAVDAAVLRALLRARKLVLTCPQSSTTLIASWLGFIALDLFLSTSNACFALH
jgi:hypothetical protein